jgi:phosphoadenosine phosphosulfate reductase
LEHLEQYLNELQSLNAKERLGWALKTFGKDNVLLASSLGIEDQVLTHMILECESQARVFTLDTGRQFQENYDAMQATMQRYGMTYEVGFPDPEAVRALTAKGPNLFYESIENRKECCQVRKLAPLQGILATGKIWITGLRASQSITRSDMQVLEWDAAFGLWKLNALLDWSEEQTWAFAKEHQVPYNKLHDQGFPSIGCAPCTRAVAPGEDLRAGRWWWELPESKECGLHWVDGKMVRIAKDPSTADKWTPMA